MDIHLTPYDEKFIIELGGEKIILRFWKTEEVDLFKIGIEAPKKITIAREEVYKEKMPEIFQL